MRKLIVGPPRSGKSEAAERSLLGHGANLGYIATLPRHPATITRIERHRARRNSRWRLVEVEIWSPVSREACLKLLQESDAVLLDGLSELMWAELQRGNIELETLLHPRRQILMLLRAARASWLVVDLDADSLQDLKPKEFAHFMRDMHVMIRDLEQA